MENILKAAGLKKYYGKGDTMVKALDGVDLEIERGKFTAIIGTSEYAGRSGYADRGQCENWRYRAGGAEQ